MINYCRIRFSNLERTLLERITVRNGFGIDGSVVTREENFTWRLDCGVYIWEFDGKDEYCSVAKVFTVREQDLEKNIEIPLLRKDGRQAEGQDEIFLYSDQLENLLYRDEMNGLLEHKFDTPAFDKRKNLNQFTSSAERKKFLLNIIKNCKFAFFKEELFPIVILTKEKIKNEKNIFRILKNSKKLNVLYQAQLHGNEYASGEGALYIIKELTRVENEYLLDDINIVILPCINQEGSDKGIREYKGINLNRDFLECSSDIMENLHTIFFSFMPEVVIDAHTFTRRNSFKNNNIVKGLFDVRISSANTKNMDLEIIQESEKIIEKTFSHLETKGFRAGYYNNSTDSNIGRIYYSLLGGYSFLYESEGTQSGKFHFKRNVFSQIYGILFIIRYVTGNSKDLKATVNRNRRRMLKKTLFSEDKETFTIKHGISGEKEHISEIDNYNFFGEKIREKEKIHFPIRDCSLEEVFLPEKIYIDKTKDYAEDLVKKLRKNYVKVIEERTRYAINLRQKSRYIIIEVMAQCLKNKGGINELLR